ncbi:poly-gamma-glutamate synthesis protein (capsule biosynthesis protein) [Micromonospora pallida]|uniref:Poly-gamma-glutamate synthesis protein (Capsule biosynthesis protein) n=1 Tax=Micromonospora pallida TaxID=145854 RepID=A0A1C6SFX8_9ACTN|nr:CapA family protein [Micromonospora pallida]SCL28374.1 poly-gamma-glutamate synthesis protein (capsule biosynthesis protein) [Micromonospora pallida]
MPDLTLFLGGDVMTGRGVDAILPTPGPPELRERAVRDARDYVDLAQAANGPIPRPAPPAWPWGEALDLLDDVRPDVRVVNLETAVTGRGTHAPAKAIHYRMHPGNLACLTAARLDVCALANNHVLDFGPVGLTDTLDALAGAAIATAGAGRDAASAGGPTRVPLGQDRDLLVWSVAAPSSGVPSSWAATAGTPGVAYLPEVSAASADALAGRIAAVAGPGDRVLVSVHWGTNWGYDVPPEHVDFAHRLVDAGVDVVHGHSSHHPRPVEVYRDRLVLYGCGDLIDDYEGIAGQEEYRPHLRLLWLPTLDAATGVLRRLRAAPMRMRRMRLARAAPDETRWLAELLDGFGPPFAPGFAVASDGLLTLRPH